MRTPQFGSWMSSMTRTPCPFRFAEFATDRSPKDGYGVECFANIGEARGLPDVFDLIHAENFRRDARATQQSPTPNPRISNPPKEGSHAGKQRISISRHRHHPRIRH
jgi:hypothetical protein